MAVKIALPMVVAPREEIAAAVVAAAANVEKKLLTGMNCPDVAEIVLHKPVPARAATENFSSATE